MDGSGGQEGEWIRLDCLADVTRGFPGSCPQEMVAKRRGLVAVVDCGRRSV